jgi:Zn-dependent peptidase ImmA (M78 family)
MIHDYQHVKQKAEELIEKYALTTPVQVFQLADMLNIQWKTYDVDEFSQIVMKKDPAVKKLADEYRWEDVLGYYDPNENIMLINNTSQPITRKRFTMAHEIGHHELHHELNHQHLRAVFLRQDIVEPRDQIEAEANYFAGYLLMPDKEIKKKLPYTDLMFGGEMIITELAKLFAVSHDAMRIRLKTFKQEQPDEWEKYHMEEKLF